MAKPLRIILVLLGLVLVIALAVSVLANTRFSLMATESETGELSVETNFPNASCQKILSQDFPFVHFECQEYTEADEGLESSNEIFQEQP